MIWVILYTLIGYPILYVVYRNVFGIEFTKKKWPYVLVIGGTCLLQVLLGGTSVSYTHLTLPTKA